MSDPAPKIYVALAKVMADLDHVAKTEVNNYDGFKFRGIDTVINAVGPILRKHKVVVVPDVKHVSYDAVLTSTGKPSNACRLVASYHFYADDGSTISTTVAAEAWDRGDKATPKAMSVAFRIALLQALSLPTGDPDPDAFSYERAQGTPPKPMSKTTQGKLFALFVQKGIPESGQLSGINKVLGSLYRSRGDLSESDALKVIESLKTMPDALPTPPAEVANG